ncbi:MAG: Tfp pilus assembly protein FimT/FimU [Chthoniobacteraceae bacterium]
MKIPLLFIARFRFSRNDRVVAFSLIELLVVMAVVAGMMTLVVPALHTGRGAGSLSSAVYEIAGLVDQARSYAMANNTHVFVGVVEVDATQDSTASMPVTGVGRVVIAIVASRDGSSGYYGADSDSIEQSWSDGGAYGQNLLSVAKIYQFENVHIADTITSSGEMNRPEVEANYRIGNAKFTSLTPFNWPLSSSRPTGKYRFEKVIEFDPKGVAIIQSSTNINTLTPYIELGLQPAAGSAILSNSNVAVIQIDGMTGTPRVYRP